EKLHQPVGQRRVPPDLPERVRLHGDRRGLQGGPRDLARPPPQPAALVQAHDPRRRAPALGHSHRAVHARLVVDVQLALQRGELDGHRARYHGPARPELARPEVLRDGGGGHGQRLARAALLRHALTSDRARDRPHRRGRRDLALSLPGAGAGRVGAASLRPQAGLLMAGFGRRKFWWRIASHLLLIPFLVFALFPFYHMALTSLKTDRELYDRNAVPLLIRQGPTLEHYTKLLWETAFLTWTKNSLLITILATALSVVVGTIAAYALARLRFFGVSSFGTGIFVTYLVPTSL